MNKSTIEKFPMSRVNEAFEHLRASKARYRIVLENDIPMSTWATVECLVCQGALLS